MSARIGTLCMIPKNFVRATNVKYSIGWVSDEASGGMNPTIYCAQQIEPMSASVDPTPW